jgi:hypothetical protein
MVEVEMQRRKAELGAEAKELAGWRGYAEVIWT